MGALYLRAALSEKQKNWRIFDKIGDKIGALFRNRRTARSVLAANGGSRPGAESEPRAWRSRPNILARHQNKLEKERFMKRLTRMLAGAATLLFTTGIAAAATVVADADLNVRSGPGIQYPVIAVIPDGVAVDSTGCQGGWCHVVYRGHIGWASSAYLTSAVAAAPYYYNYPYYAEPYYYGPISFGYGYYYRHHFPHVAVDHFHFHPHVAFHAPAFHPHFAFHAAAHFAAPHFAAPHFAAAPHFGGALHRG
jgi:uncharacterized protein YraI